MLWPCQKVQTLFLLSYVATLGGCKTRFSHHSLNSEVQFGWRHTLTVKIRLALQAALLNVL